MADDKKNTARVSIYVPRELRDRMSALEDGPLAVNWSAACRSALAEECDRLEAIAEQLQPPRKGTKRKR